MNLLKIALKEYENWKKTDAFGEEYKYDILKELNTYFQGVTIDPENVLSIAKKLNQMNPSEGALVHWSNLNDLVKYAEAAKKQLVDELNHLLKSNGPIDERIKRFREKASEVSKDYTFGTPFFGYIFAAYDMTNYTPFKDGDFSNYCQLLLLDKETSISKKYLQQLEIVNELNNYDVIDSILDAQSFLHVLNQDQFKFKVLIKYLSKMSKELDQLMSNEELFFKYVNELSNEELNKISEHYKNSEKINGIRYEFANQVIEASNTNLNDIENIYYNAVEKIASKYNTNIMQSWGFSNILFPFYYEKHKKFVKKYLKDISEIIIRSLNINQKLIESSENDFLWNQGFGNSEAWIAFYPEKYKSHKEAIQFFLAIKPTGIEIGLMNGSKNELKIKETKIIESMESITLENIIGKFNSQLKKFNKLNDMINYFWISANPDIWKVKDHLDKNEIYKAYNDEGNKRRIFNNFEKAKRGDQVIIYESSPTQKVIAKAEIENSLEYVNDKNGIEIKIDKELIDGLTWEEIIKHPELKNSTVVNNKAQGTLFEISKKEYEILCNEKTNNRIWVISAGNYGELKEDFLQNEIIAHGWDDLRDMTNLSEEEISAIVSKHYDNDNKDNTIKALNDFVNNIQINDEVILKTGTNTRLAYGKIISEVIYDDTRENYKSYRQVKWIDKEEVNINQSLANKTLTEITDNKDLFLELNKNILERRFIELITILGSINEKIWGVQEKNGNIRILVGSFLVAVLYKDSIWLSLHNKDLEQIENMENWTHNEEIDNKFYSEYQNIPAINGSFSLKPIENSNHYWEIVKNSFKDIMNNINNKWEILRKTSRSINDFRILEAFEDKYDITLPRPKYDSDENLKVDFNVKFTFEDKSLVFEEGILEALESQISIALRNGKNIILVGPPGTGKSKLAKEICNHYRKSEYNLITANSDWSTFDTIGGYKPQKDGSLKFQPGLFLKQFKNNKENINRWLIIDEINRADIDKAFGAFFSALAGDQVNLSFEDENGENIVITNNEADDKNNHHYLIHNDWRLIATMNTLDKTSLYEMSYAFMRRFAFISVPSPRNISNELIHRYLSVWKIENNEYVEDIKKVWQLINNYRKIGPALIEDFYKYLVASQGDYASAINMFVIPQLEGVYDDKIIELRDKLSEFDFIKEEDMLKDFINNFFMLEE